jgi:quercetin dioxygenase-like cupin family protein/type 1 glutamine amidotransferase
MTMRMFLLFILCFGSIAGAATASAAEPPKAQNIILIVGAPTTGDGGRRAYFQGVRALEGMLKTAPAFAADEHVVVHSAPFGWPEPRELANVRTIVLYNDAALHPLADPVRRQVVEGLIARGVGLVALHRAASGDMPETWFGGRITGEGEGEALFRAKSASKAAALVAGVPALDYIGEAGDKARLLPSAVPLLRAEAIPVARAGGAEAPFATPVAWRYQRADGGRSFAFSGGLDVRALDVPGIRTLLLNGILWASGMEVPRAGATTAADPALAARQFDPRQGKPRFTTSAVARAADSQTLPQPWGKIIWYVSGPLGNSEALTTGVAIVDAGKANPRHFHPNSDEVLHVLSGRIRHTMNDVTVEMKPGDTVSIPRGTFHNATNIGEEPARLAISFDTAWREVIGE